MWRVHQALKVLRARRAQLVPRDLRAKWDHKVVVAKWDKVARGVRLAHRARPARRDHKVSAAKQDHLGPRDLQAPKANEVKQGLPDLPARRPRRLQPLSRVRRQPLHLQVSAEASLAWKLWSPDKVGDIKDSEKLAKSNGLGRE